MSVESVRSNILNAWHDAHLIPADEIGYSYDGLDLESDAVSDFFAGKPWQAVTLEELMKYKGDGSACLSFMSPSAYRYYLPSYMIIALDNYIEADVSADSAWWSLSPPTDSTLNNYWADRITGFSNPQKEAILLFLKFMLIEHGDDYPSRKHSLMDAVKYWENTL